MRRTIAALVVVALLGASGCEEQPEADGAPPSVPPSPTVETSLTTSEPTVDPRNETGRQFIHRYIETVNEMQRTGDATDYRAMLSRACRSCEEFAQRIEGIYERGGWIRTRGERVVSARSDGGPTQWLVEITAEPTRYRPAAGKPVKALDGGTYEAHFYLRDRPSGWLVVATSQIAS